jgi:putative oxidoreductase
LFRVTGVQTCALPISVTAAGANFGQPGYETDLLYIAALVALVLGGSGPLAVDRYLWGSRAS